MGSWGPLGLPVAKDAPEQKKARAHEQQTTAISSVVSNMNYRIVHTRLTPRYYTISQNKVTIGIVVTPAQAGVQAACNVLKILDSGVRRNDGRRGTRTRQRGINFAECSSVASNPNYRRVHARLTPRSLRFLLCGLKGPRHLFNHKIPRSLLRGNL